MECTDHEDVKWVALLLHNALGVSVTVQDEVAQSDGLFARRVVWARLAENLCRLFAPRFPATSRHTENVTKDDLTSCITLRHRTR
jgi:hypothetical protein